MKKTRNRRFSARQARAACALAALGAAALPQTAAHAQKVTPPVWAARLDTGSVPDVARALATAADGSVYVFAQSNSGTVQPTNVDMRLVKYNASGVQQWQYTYATDKDDRPVAVALAPDGNPVILASTTASGPGTTQDFFVAKINRTNGAQVWQATFNAPANKSETGDYLAIDNAGNVVVTGRSQAANGTNDIAVVKLNGATGAKLWDYFYDATGRSDSPRGLATDAQGNVFFVGIAKAAGSGATTQDDFVTVKLSSAGALQFAALYQGEGTGGNDAPTGIGLDATGNVYVTGSATFAGTGADGVTIKYSSAGAQLWLARDKGNLAASNDTPRYLQVGKDGFPYLVSTGASNGRPTAYYVKKLSPSSGATVWQSLIRPPHSAFVSGLALGETSGATASVYVLLRASYVAGNNLSDYAVYKFAATNGAPQALARYNAAADGNDDPVALAVSPDGASVYVTGAVSDTYAANDSAAVVTVKYNSALALPYIATDLSVDPVTGKPFLLWARPDGAAALWRIAAATTTIEKGYVIPALANAIPKSVAVGADGRARVLYETVTGGAVVRTIKADMTGVESSATFAPAGYLPAGIAMGRTDGKARLLWYDSAGRAALWTLNVAGSAVESGVAYGPYMSNAQNGTLWLASGLGVAGDNSARVLWESAPTDQFNVWNVAANYNILNGTVYGPLAFGTTPGNAYAADDLAVGPTDNKPYLLWTAQAPGAAQTLAFWRLSPAGTSIELGKTYGPYVGLGAKRLAIGPSDKARLLWNRRDGSVALWRINTQTGAVEVGTYYGPY